MQNTIIQGAITYEVDPDSHSPSLLTTTKINGASGLNPKLDHNSKNEMTEENLQPHLLSAGVKEKSQFDYVLML